MRENRRREWVVYILDVTPPQFEGFLLAIAARRLPINNFKLQIFAIHFPKSCKVLRFATSILISSKALEGRRRAAQVGARRGGARWEATRSHILNGRQLQDVRYVIHAITFSKTFSFPENYIKIGRFCTKMPDFLCQARHQPYEPKRWILPIQRFMKL